MKGHYIGDWKFSRYIGDLFKKMLELLIIRFSVESLLYLAVCQDRDKFLVPQ